MATPPSIHRAALLTATGSPFTIQTIKTPVPGPHEVLIAVKSIALNPIDLYQRLGGVMIDPPSPTSPAVTGFDIAGTIASIGSKVWTTNPVFKPGAKVVAFAATIATRGKPEYGAFQEYVLVPTSNIAVIPSALAYNEAAKLPMSVLTTWSAWTTLGLSYDTKATPADKKGMLIWGASSSTGTSGVQIASKTLGYTVYAVASAKHHAYLKSLGAHALFDHHDANVVDQIINVAKSAGLTLNLAFHATGDLKAVQTIVEVFGNGSNGGARVATAVTPGANDPVTEGVESKFILPPKDVVGHYTFVFNKWLPEALSNGKFDPAPKTEVVPGGLEAVNKGLDLLSQGVSGVKLVVEVSRD